MRIAIAGATGVVGRQVLAQAAAAGHEVVPLSRATGVDLTRPDGLAEHLAGVDATIDCAGPTTQSARKAIDFFTTTSTHLTAAGAAAGVRHHVTLSIVGIDGSSFGYYRGKVAQEEAVRRSAVPSSIVRATQFHEFADQMVERMSVGPVHLAPRLLCAPVAATEVAAALLDVAVGEPRPDTLEMGGPEERPLVDMVRAVVHERGLRGPVIPVSVPGRSGKAMRTGSLVPADPWRRGTQTFDEWLATIDA